VTAQDRHAKKRHLAATRNTWYTSEPGWSSQRGNDINACAAAFETVPTMLTPENGVVQRLCDSAGPTPDRPTAPGSSIINSFERCDQRLVMVLAG